MEKTSPYGGSNHRELERSSGDPMEELKQLASKQLTQSRPLILVPECGLFDVGLRLRLDEEAGGHSQRERRCFNFSVISSRTSSQGLEALGSVL